MERWLPVMACVFAVACVDIDAVRRRAIGADSTTSCDSAAICSTEHATRCAEGALSTCTMSAAGCLSWVQTVRCASGSCASPTDCGGCTNSCERAGVSQCLGNASRTCIADAQGCLMLGPPVDCGDDVACTVDGCDPTSGACTHMPDDSMCTALSGNSCKVARCDVEEGCMEVDRTGSCDDSDACTVDDACSGGMCRGPLDTQNAACIDECPDDPHKTRPGTCGCGEAENPADSDLDDIPNCVDPCPVENCDVVSKTECVEGMIGTCTRDADGCLSRPSRACSGGYCYDPATCGAQTIIRDWNLRLPGTWNVSVAINAAGEAFVAGLTTIGLDGNTYLGGASDMFLSKWSADGLRLWTKQFGTSGEDRVHDVLVDVADNVVVVGQTDSALPGSTHLGHWDAVITMWNGSGSTPPASPSWQVQFGTSTWDWLRSAALTSDGGLYVLGDTAGAFPGHTNAGRNDTFLARFSRNATAPDWIRQWGTPGLEGAESVLAASDRGAFTTHTVGEPEQSELRRYSSSGTLMWTRVYPTLLLAAAIGPDGDPILTNVKGTNGVAKAYDTSGEPIWTADGSPFALAATVAADGSIYVAGNVLSRYSPTGELLWSQPIRIANYNLVLSGVAAHRDFVVAVGYDNSDGNPYFVQLKPEE